MSRNALRTAAAINDDVAMNPYTSVLGQRLSERVDAVQRAYVSTHHCDLRSEMAVMRATVQDIVAMYANVTALIEASGDGAASPYYQTLLDVGKEVRLAMREVRDFAGSIAAIEKSFRDLHDPVVTRDLINKAVDAIDNALRESARMGDLPEQIVNELMAKVARDVDEGVRVAAGTESIEFTGPSKITPDSLVTAMHETVLGPLNVA